MIDVIYGGLTWIRVEVKLVEFMKRDVTKSCAEVYKVNENIVKVYIRTKD